MRTTMYTNKNILIIGGTGTIGRRLTKELLEQNPKVIRIFSRDEYKQFEMQQELQNHKNIRYLIGDVRDENRLLRAMEDIDYVFHLAAMKHVPACEYNPFEAVQTNVLGTQNVIQAALTTNVKKVLFTSTDKAIAPTNTYGATKLTAERLISAAQYQKGPKQTIFSSVRFGNVMGSRGSVIPLFIKQIVKENKITVTDANMLRYMMTSTQAINLILEANEIAKGGEVFVLKMPIIKLCELVDVLIEEVTQKYNLSKAVAIKQIGIRPGEKMFEELMTEDEVRVGLETGNMYIIQAPYVGSHSYKDAHPIHNPPRVREDAAIDKETLRSWILEEKLVDNP
ncbi:SDR family NAD(P)-dependent oxidoreductase [Robertmurraya sp. DFI.2.37]|uniref:SDR family NAD(P)-dependent oxidoreductase n=1 Tax=Robertmurraya sp. DFI.2.37 TaxID=3031819 RepID=UPI001247A0E7|nr:SDR family NAD(P)-dependent oxidoreductase [Robertmurraya sp. DFI.2.37]MDF1507832.1 SDR family NAD(P)-dependent oxidoreductase [Robertmurraya sp. DFI.2.37]